MLPVIFFAFLLTITSFKLASRASFRPAPQEDFMDIDDPVQVETREPLSLPLSAARNHLNSFSLPHVPFVSYPREVREIPIEVKDRNGPSGNSEHGPIIENITGRDSDHGPSVRGTVIIDEEDDNIPAVSTAHVTKSNERAEISSQYGNVQPSAPVYDNSSDFTDVEEEMVRAAIEASKRDIEGNFLVQGVCDSFPLSQVCLCNLLPSAS